MTLNERFTQGWEARRGEPLVYVPVTPSVYKGHTADARLYTYHIATFVLRVFHNRETDLYEDANNAIIHLSIFYIEHPDVRDDFNSLYWHAGELFRTIFHFGSLGDEEPGLVSPKAQELFLKMILGFCNDNSKWDRADNRPLKTWRIFESENHHVQMNSALWQFMLLLIQYGYGDEPMADGGTIRSHFQAWTDFFTTWMKERATRSMFVETHSKVYGVETMKNIYPLYDFAPTPEFKKLTYDFITLFWALWAEEQIHGVQGGGQSRVYAEHAVISFSPLLSWAWYYTGLGDFHLPYDGGGAGDCNPPSGATYIALDCSYRIPDLILNLILHPEKRGTYITESRPFGKAAPDDLYPIYRPDTDWGQIYRYSYCTPDYILGTLMFPQLSNKDWLLISSQNRFQGLTFNQFDAMILPIPEPDEMHPEEKVRPRVGFNSYWSEQAEGTLITQRCADYGAPMRVFFSGAGDVRTNVTEKDDWYFTFCDNAYVAIKICQGSFIWEDDYYVPGQWMRCDVPTTPIIIETGNQERFGSYEAFQDAVTKLAPTWDGAVMKYHSLYGHNFVFVTDGDSEESTIDGEYYVKKPDFSFKSPFVNGAWGGDQVKITFDGEEMLLKF